METPIPNRTTPSVANRTDAFSDEWRCEFYDITGKCEVDDELRCVRLAVRVDSLGRHWCDIEDHGA